MSSADVDAETPDDVVDTWEPIKADERREGASSRIQRCRPTPALDAGITRVDRAIGAASNTQGAIDADAGEQLLQADRDANRPGHRSRAALEAALRRFAAQNARGYDSATALRETEGIEA